MTTLRVWAPRARQVQAQASGNTVDLVEVNGGWWEGSAALDHGDDYAFRLDGGPPRPDPRSLWQPSGVHAASRHYDHDRFVWHDGGWRGRPLAGSILYELHVGTFTPDGTFDAAVNHLDYLVDLGIDAVELLPVAAWDGTAGWGYDGVDLYAVHEPYGGPDGLKRFVDACHVRGLAVVLDVVYNHLGPSGNYLAEYGPYFAADDRTPWGPAVNLDGPDSDEVRRFLIDNAVGWCRDFHVDGLRLDAVHAMVDTRPVHLVEELSAEIRALSARLGRQLWVIAESDRNDPRLVTPVEGGGQGVDAVWDDDVHHALHALLTGERQGYYVDFGSLPAAATALESAYWLGGRYSRFRRRHHGRPVDRTRTPGHRFVTYLQNHDQVGNRATGERLSALLSPGLLRVAAALLLTSPYLPMLFMGEEWGATTPWRYFTSFSDPDLAAAVTRGRREEFAGHGWPQAAIPDPQDPGTLASSRLDWSEPERDPHAATLAWYRELIRLRRTHPDFGDDRLDRVSCTWNDDPRWLVMRRGDTAVVCNLSAGRCEVPVAGRPRELLAASAPGFVYRDGCVELDAESVVIVTLA